MGRRLIFHTDDPAGACGIRRERGSVRRASGRHAGRRRAGFCCVWLRRPCNYQANRLRSYYQVVYQFPWNLVYILGTHGPSHSLTPSVKQSVINLYNSTPPSNYVKSDLRPRRQLEWRRAVGPIPRLQRPAQRVLVTPRMLGDAEAHGLFVALAADDHHVARVRPAGRRAGWRVGGRRCRRNRRLPPGRRQPVRLPSPP